MSPQMTATLYLGRNIWNIPFRGDLQKPIYGISYRIYSTSVPPTEHFRPENREIGALRSLSCLSLGKFKAP